MIKLTHIRICALGVCILLAACAATTTTGQPNGSPDTGTGEWDVLPRSDSDSADISGTLDSGLYDIVSPVDASSDSASILDIYIDVNRPGDLPTDVPDWRQAPLCSSDLDPSMGLSRDIRYPPTILVPFGPLADTPESATTTFSGVLRGLRELASPLSSPCAPEFAGRAPCLATHALVLEDEQMRTSDVVLGPAIEDLQHLGMGTRGSVTYSRYVSNRASLSVTNEQGRPLLLVHRGRPDLPFRAAGATFSVEFETPVCRTFENAACFMVLVARRLRVVTDVSAQPLILSPATREVIVTSMGRYALYFRAIIEQAQSRCSAPPAGRVDFELVRIGD